MKLAALAGFAAGTVIVVIALLHELSDGAEKLKAEAQAAEEAKWRAFLAKWEAAR